MSQVNLSIRNVAIVGSYLSGKTTLLESILYVTQAISRKGRLFDRNDSMDINCATTEYQEIRFNLIDCPGAVELYQQSYQALIGVDLAIIVTTPSDRSLTLFPLFKFLDDYSIPHLLFINKVDRIDPNHNSFGEEYLQLIHSLKSVSSRPLVPQQYPITQGNNIIGYIDLVTEQAYHYHLGSPADLVPIPREFLAEEQAARTEMLETLADFDDHLLEELLEEIQPSTQEIEQDLIMELGADLIVPVFFGIAQQDYGVRPLLQALLKEAPIPSITTKKRGITSDETIAQVLKTYYSSQGGKLSVVRIWSGAIADGMVLNGVRVGGLYRLIGNQSQPIQQAEAGDIIALARMEGIKTGDTLTTNNSMTLNVIQLIPPVYGLAIMAQNRKDEVKLNTALSKLLEEDPSLTTEYRSDTHELILWGQGNQHLEIAINRLQNKYNLPVNSKSPQIPYRESICKSAIGIHGRYKHQSGGHGQFGDVYLDIHPLNRGQGFSFNQTIVGGVVPKQYIPGVEMGVREYLEKGPLGFPIVDISVSLTNGSYHSVDSSEQAFKQAARLAMQEGIPKCEPILLEPIMSIEVSTPNEFTSKVLQLITTHRGQILGYDHKSDWLNWDVVSGYIPQAEMQTFITELRSLTLGVGFFYWEFDRLQEVR